MKCTKHSFRLVLLLLLALTLSLTVSCGKEKGTTSEESTATTPVETTNDDTASTDAEDSTSDTPTDSTEAPPALDLPLGEVLLSGEVTLSSPLFVTDEAHEYATVLRALSDLQNDFKAVTGNTPAVKGALEATSTTLIVGTIGQNDFIDSLIAGGTLDVSEIEGQWEAYKIGVYAGLGAEKTVVIAGSDARGTIYGIYAVSEMIGVSPWYWWADVPITENKALSLSVCDLTEVASPDVKYRGIFINDEEASAIWAKQYENNTDSQGSPNPYIYGKIFELLLRLKANTLWPAMHATSDAFNAIVNPDTGVAYNAELAGEYGIVMGSSHCEMLLCNNETEWVPWCEANVGKYNLKKINNDWKSSYDYTVNAEAMNAYWEERVAANYMYENIYTIGLRGVHDSEILCSNLTDTSWAGKADVVRQAIEAQIAILEKYEDIYEQTTGVRREFATCFCPYKEAAEYYKYDLSLPSDCIILFADDNYGYVRQYPTNAELETYAGCGVYYHVSYRGVPRSYLWIDSMPLSLIYEEMHKSFTAGSDDMWILNVGDLKPAEFSINFFLDLAWDEASVSGDDLEAWMQDFFASTFSLSSSDAKTLADLHSDFLQIAYAYRADFQGYNEGNEYAINAFGDEAQRVINQMEAILEEVSTIYEKLPASEKDAFFEIVLYRIRATLYTLEKNIYAQKNKLYLDQGRFTSVNAYAALAEEAYQNILKDLNTYNSLQNGKWKGIMDPYITDNGSPVITGAPDVTYLSYALAADGVGAAAEGQSGTSAVTLTFNSLDDTVRFLDIFGRGLSRTTFRIETAPSVIIRTADGQTLSYTDKNGVRIYTGEVGVETRCYISIEWAAVSASTTLKLTVSDSFGYSISYPLSLTKETVDPSTESNKGYYEVNGYISIEAEHYSDNVAVNGMEWRVVENLGVSGDSMKAYPDHSADFTRIDYDYETDSPYLEYHFYVSSAGTFSGAFYRIPTLNEGNTDDLIHKTCRIGWTLDGGAIDYFRGTSLVDTGTGSAWSNGVRYNYEIKSFSITVRTAGWHTLRVYLVDAGCAFDKIVLRRSTVSDTPSRLGHPETFNTVFYEKTALGVPPSFTLDEVVFKDGEGATLLYDFTVNASSAQSGYIGVDNTVASVSTKRYAWTDGFDSLNAALRTSSSISSRDGGILYSESSATFTVDPGASGRYIVAISVGDRSASGFAVSNMTVSVGGVTYLEGINQAAGGTSEYAFVIDVSDGMLPITFGGKWAVSSVEIRPYVEYAAPNGPASANDEGDVILEAEWALENSDYFKSEVSRDGQNYRFMETAGEYGSAVYFGPNTGNSYSSTDVNASQSARLSFAVELRAGTYTIFGYVKCEEDNDDSLILSLDGAQVQSANDFKLTGGEYKVFRLGSITVEEDGSYTLLILGREDGLAIDRLMITQKSVWVD